MLRLSTQMQHTTGQEGGKTWVEPVYDQEMRISQTMMFSLSAGLFLLLYWIKYAVYGPSEYWIGTAFWVFVFMVAAGTAGVQLRDYLGKKDVLVSDGYWKTVPVPVKIVPPSPSKRISPLYLPYPSKEEGYRPPSDTTYGSAQWEDPRTIAPRFADRSGESRGFLINATTWVGEHMHGFCMAGTGQGKGVSIILPNLLSRPTCSWFVLDLKGENAQITARWQKEAGQTVHILDPWNEQKRFGATHGIEPSGCNPLDFIRGIPDEIPESCAAIAVMIAPDEAQTKDPYWNGRARALIEVYLLHLMSSQPESEQHLGTIYKWLRLAKEERLILWYEMRLSTAFDGEVERGINEFFEVDTDKGPLSSILSNAHEQTAFLRSESLRKSLSQSDLNPYNLNDGKTTVYVCLPERYLKSHAKWLRLIVCVCLKSCNYRPNKRVNFILDELAILGKMPDVQDAYAFIRGQKVCMYSFIQSLSQLYDIYGQYAAEAMLSCARLRQFFGVFDLASQKYLSEYLGEKTVKAISNSKSDTVGGSVGSTSGKSSTTGSSSSGTDNWSTSFSIGESSSDSVTDSWSHTDTETHTPVGRRLLTAEEIGKSHQIITFIDGHKYLLPRVPFWRNYYLALIENGVKFLPKNWEEWKYYNHALWGWVTDDSENELDIVGRKFKPRADGRVVGIDLINARDKANNNGDD